MKVENMAKKVIKDSIASTMQYAFRCRSKLASVTTNNISPMDKPFSECLSSCESTNMRPGYEQPARRCD